MSRFDLTRQLRFNILVLKIGGLWPSQENFLARNFYTLYAVLSLFFLAFLHNLSQLINIYFIYDQLETLTLSAIVAITEFMGFIKFMLFIRNLSVLHELMTILRSDLFQPRNGRQKSILNGYLANWMRIYVCFSTSAAMTLLLWGLYPIINQSTKFKQLPFIAWYPYDYKQYPYYHLTYLYQVVANYFIAFTNQNVDAFISALLMFISAQFEILCDNLHEMQQQRDIDSEFFYCIQQHRQILRFASCTNNFISVSAFGQFATSVISICMTMFQLTVLSPSTPEFYTLVCCQLAVFNQLLVYCWFGNKVIFTSQKVAYAAYECSWLNASIEFKKNLLFFIEQSQKPIIIKAGGFFSLSLETFTLILRTSYSYFALLCQLNRKNATKN